MELMKLSKFKIHLQALATEVRDLRVREHSAQQQINLSEQKQKQAEEEFVGRIKELQTELADSNENQRKLERKVSSLENDNALLENKQKELKETINNLLQSRESFVKVYEDSTCKLKEAVLTRDKKYTVLSEKLSSHMSLFDSISKEASSVKQILDIVQRLVTEKEGIVTGLKCKMDNISSFEKVFVAKICDLECKLKDHEDELRKKDKTISELEAQLENSILTNICLPQIEELQTTLSMKDVVIENLQSEKKVLQSELCSLGIIFQKVQIAVTDMNEKEKRAFTSVLEGQEERLEDEGNKPNCLEICHLSSTEDHSIGRENEDDRNEDMNQSIRENSTSEGCENNSEAKTDSICREHDSLDKSLQGNNSSQCSIPVARQEPYISLPSEYRMPSSIRREQNTQVMSTQAIRELYTNFGYQARGQ